MNEAHWIFLESTDAIICSACDSASPTDDGDFPFCPFCGRRMTNANPIYEVKE